LDIDPTSPKPGPTFPMQAMDAVTPVVKSRPEAMFTAAKTTMISR
jgi:hypothetical protein